MFSLFKYWHTERNVTASCRTTSCSVSSWKREVICQAKQTVTLVTEKLLAVISKRRGLHVARKVSTQNIIAGIPNQNLPFYTLFESVKTKHIFLDIFLNAMLKCYTYESTNFLKFGCWFEKSSVEPRMAF